MEERLPLIKSPFLCFERSAEPPLLSRGEDAPTCPPSPGPTVARGEGGHAAQVLLAPLVHGCPMRKGLNWVQS